jgi:hypothetical protein
VATPIPTRFAAGAKVIIHSGPNGVNQRAATIAHAFRTFVITDDNVHYRADADSEENGTLLRYGNGLWPTRLTLAEPGK